MTATETEGRVVDLAGAVEAAERLHDLQKQLSPQQLADAAVLVRDAVRRMQDIEIDFITALGRATGAGVGETSDGRRYEVLRRPDRSNYDHAEWKRDVRRVITERINARFLTYDDKNELIDRETSEVVTLAHIIQTALGEVQKVHGAAPPLSGGLKALNLYPTDYCVSQPGGWRLSTTRPNESEAGR